LRRLATWASGVVRIRTNQRGVRAHDALLVWQRGRVVERARVEVEDARGGERARRKGRPCEAPYGFSSPGSCTAGSPCPSRCSSWLVDGELLVGPRAPRLAAPRVLAVVRVAPLEHRLFGPLVGRVECGVHPGQRLSGALELWSKLPRGRCGFARLTGWVVGGHLPCHFWRGHGAGQEALQEGRGGCRVVRRGRPRGGRAGRAGRGPR